MHLSAISLRKEPSDADPHVRFKRYQDFFTQMRGLEIGKMSIDELRAAFLSLDTIAGATTPIVVGQPWFRARKCDGRQIWNHTRDLVYPDPRKVKIGIGRANLAGSPVLYAAGNVSTLLSEIRGEPGDWVQIIGFRLKQGAESNCFLIGELEHLHKARRSMYGLTQIDHLFAHIDIASQRKHPHYLFWLSLVMLDAFLGEQFRKQIADAGDYKLTAVIGDFLLRRAKPGNSHVDCIGYPSVAFYTGQNIAIRPKSFTAKYEIFTSAVWELKRYLGYGVWEYEVVCQSDDIKRNGAIVWPKNIMRRIAHLGRLRRQSANRSAKRRRAKRKS